jgi:hypothetical protein
MTYASGINILHRLIYFSTFSSTFPTEREQQDDEIANIVRTSVLNNSEFGLTGLLLAHQNWFLQVLEGPEDRLMTCYGAIASDSRHVDPTLMGVGPIPKRNFYNWGMCSRRLNKTNDAILEALDVKGPFSPKALNFENALKLLMAVRAMHSRPEPMAGL